MKVEKDTGAFLTFEDVSTGDLITFTNEGEIVEKEFKGKKKMAFQIGVTLPDGKEKIASLNGTSKNNMIEHYGDDTAKWVGKEARIEIIRQSVQGELKKIVYLTAPNKDFEGNILLQS